MPIKVRIEVEEEEGVQEERDKGDAPRRVKITRKYLEKYGYTDGVYGVQLGKGRTGTTGAP